MGGKLNATEVERTKVSTKDIEKNPSLKFLKKSDGDGLYLYVYRNGRKAWIYRKSFKGKEKTLGIGDYPAISLLQARAETTKYNQMIAEGIDPAEVKREKRSIYSKGYSSSCFKALAEEWYNNTKTNCAESYKRTLCGRLNKYLYPAIGNTPISEVDIDALRKISTRILNRNIVEEARRNISIVAQVFDFAINLGKVQVNPARNLLKCLPQIDKSNHMAAITDPALLGDCLRKLYSYRGINECVETLIKLAPCLLQRPSDMRTMKWEDLNLQKSEWNFVISKVKKPLVIPLPKQITELLKKLQEITISDIYVFPSPIDPNKPLSNNTVRKAYKSLGINTSELQTEHGWRATATTMLDELLGYPKRFIETQVGHSVPDPNGTAYNRTKYLKQRKVMLQAWADYLDELRNTENPDYEALRKKYSYHGFED